jgi:hypothetical protein
MQIPVVDESLVQVEAPIVRMLPDAVVDERYALLRHSRAVGKRLGEKRRPVGVGDLEPGIKGHRNPEERLQKVVVLVGLLTALAPEVLNRPKPVEVRRHVLESQERPLEDGGVVDVEDLLGRAVQPEALVDVSLHESDRGQQGADGEGRFHGAYFKFLCRKIQHEATSSRLTQIAA